MSFFSKLSVGAMRHRVTIQEKVRVTDGQGGWTYTWSDVDTVWAAIKEAKASEKLFAERLEQNVTHKIYMRYRSAMSTDYRISYGSRIFQIHGFSDPDEKTHWIELRVEEGVGS